MENSLFATKNRNGETPISLGVPKMEYHVGHSAKTSLIKVHLSFHGPKTLCYGVNTHHRLKHGLVLLLKTIENKMVRYNIASNLGGICRRIGKSVNYYYYYYYLVKN